MKRIGSRLPARRLLQLSRPAGIAAAATMLLVAAGQAGCTEDRRPHILLVTLDTTRADRLGPWGDEAARTPHIDALAGRGVVFERAYASSALTLPSHTTMLSGLETWEHGVRDNGRFRVPDTIETVPEILAARGYDTAAFVAAYVLDRSFGLDQGFDHYDDRVDSEDDPLSRMVPSRSGSAVTQAAADWLQGMDSDRRPWFLWVHYYDVHLPRRSPAPFNEIEDEYAAAIAHVDNEVGRLLAHVEAASPRRPVVVVVVSDHGEGLGEHDESTHGAVAWDSTLHVPLLVAGPGFEAGRRSRVFARTLDLAPTMLVAAGAPVPPAMQGRALQAWQDDRDYDPDADATIGWFEALGLHFRGGWAELSGVRDARWKLTARPEPVSLHDTLEDARELSDRAATSGDVVARLRAAHDAIVAREVLAPVLGADDPAVLERLEALGYTGGAPVRVVDGEAPDPRRFVAATGLVDAASEMVRAGRVGDGIGALRILTTAPVTRAMALRALAPALVAAGRFEEAAEVLEQQLDLSGDPVVALVLARTLAALGRETQAMELLDAAPSDSVAARLVRAEILAAGGDHASAVALADSVLRDDPRIDRALALRALSRAEVDGAGAAVDQLSEVLGETAADAGLAEARLALAELLHRSGRDRAALELLGRGDEATLRETVARGQILEARGDGVGAIAAYEEALRRWPSQVRLHERLAILREDAGDNDGALAAHDALVGAAPGDAVAHVDRGALLARMDRRDEARAAYRVAIDLDDTVAEAWFNLALLEMEDGRSAEAEGLLEKAVQRRPDYAKAHFHLARLYAERGDPRAGEHAEKATGGLR